jgi:hypothetical protein
LYEVRFTPAESESGASRNWWVRDPEFGNTATPSPCGACWPNVWTYKGKAFRIEDDAGKTTDELAVLIERRSNSVQASSLRRERIPKTVQMFVWQRDQGRCVQCGGREKLEFDHIIPVAEGGSSTERNIQLLCESCNRKKGKSVGC